MRWPWEQPEERADHADRVAAYIMAQLGKAHSDISATAAARSAALMIARCFAASTPQGGDLAKLLTPDIALSGRTRFSDFRRSCVCAGRYRR